MIVTGYTVTGYTEHDSADDPNADPITRLNSIACSILSHLDQPRHHYAHIDGEMWTFPILLCSRCGLARATGPPHRSVRYILTDLRDEIIRVDD